MQLYIHLSDISSKISNLFPFNSKFVYMISGDGRVTNWTIVKTCLWFTDELQIGYNKELLNSDVHLRSHLLDSGRAIAFKPDEDNMFLASVLKLKYYSKSGE